jgi:uncharacterized protein YjiS (DUF1127 family)
MWIYCTENNCRVEALIAPVRWIVPKQFREFDKMIGAILRFDRSNPVAATRPRPGLGRILALAGLWHRRAASRAVLRELPRDRLRDLGMTQADAWYEANKPFWK